MYVSMFINGNDISQYGLIALEGTIAALIKPNTYKDLPKNENLSMHGTVIFANPSLRKVKQRDVTLPFLFQSSSLYAMQRALNALRDDLINGTEDGVNEIYIPAIGTRFYLIFNSMPAFAHFGDLRNGMAKISIKFTEPNPNNRIYE